MIITGQYVEISSVCVPKSSAFDTICDVRGFDINKSFIKLNNQKYLISDFKSSIEDKSYPLEFKSVTTLLKSFQRVNMDIKSSDELIFNIRTVYINKIPTYLLTSILLNDKELLFNIENNTKKVRHIVFSNK
jgi:hypothetical protein